MSSFGLIEPGHPPKTAGPRHARRHHPDRSQRSAQFAFLPSHFRVEHKSWLLAALRSPRVTKPPEPKILKGPVHRYIIKPRRRERWLASCLTHGGDRQDAGVTL